MSNRRAIVRWVLALAAIGWVVATPAQARDGRWHRRHHPWGRFSPGSWKLVRVVTENLDEQGQVASTSTTETRTTLEQVNDEGVTLLVEATVEVAGKRVESAPQTIVQGWHGEPAQQPVKVSDLGTDRIVVDGQSYDCRLEEVEVSTPGGRMVTRTWYSDGVAPYVLKRESVLAAPETSQPASQTQVEVISLRRQLRLLARRREAAELRVVQRHAAGATTTRVWSTTDVPGGVVAHRSEERDKAGHAIRRSKLELVDFAAK